jgi:hypothetical protein
VNSVVLVVIPYSWLRVLKKEIDETGVYIEQSFLFEGTSFLESGYFIGS